MFGRFNEFIFHFIGDLRDFGVALLMDQPAEQIVFFHQIALVNVWNAPFIENLFVFARK